MDLQIYNKEKASKYLEFYKKNLSKKEYKEILKKFKNSLKLGNFSLSKILLQSRGINLIDYVDVDISVTNNNNIYYTVIIKPNSKSRNIDVPLRYEYNDCLGSIEKLNIADINSKIELDIEDGKFTIYENYIEIKKYIYECKNCNGKYIYNNTPAKDNKEILKFFNPVYDDNKDIISLETNKIKSILCQDGGYNCAGCKDCVYFISGYSIKFSNDGNDNNDYCNGIIEDSGETGYIGYNIVTNILNISFPPMKVSTNGYLTIFQYESKTINLNDY